jgi:hypothetical protein
MTTFIDELIDDAETEAEFLLGQIEDLAAHISHPVHFALYDQAKKFRQCLEQGQDLAESQIRQLQGIYGRLAADILGEPELN